MQKKNHKSNKFHNSEKKISQSENQFNMIVFISYKTITANINTINHKMNDTVLTTTDLYKSFNDSKRNIN